MSLLQLVSLAVVMAAALFAIMAAAWQIQRGTGHTGWIDVAGHSGQAPLQPWPASSRYRTIIYPPRGRSWLRP